jgi:hypothetical protein
MLLSVISGSLISSVKSLISTVYFSNNHYISPCFISDLTSHSGRRRPKEEHKRVGQSSAMMVKTRHQHHSQRPQHQLLKFKMDPESAQRSDRSLMRFNRTLQSCPASAGHQTASMTSIVTCVISSSAVELPGILPVTHNLRYSVANGFLGLLFRIGENWLDES